MQVEYMKTAFQKKKRKKKGRILFLFFSEKPKSALPSTIFHMFYVYLSWHVVISFVL